MSDIDSYAMVRNRLLRTERKRRGWTQARLANALGVVTRTVIRWELGLALPHPGHRVQLETLFGKTAEELGLLWDTDKDEGNDLQVDLFSVAQPAMPKGTRQALLEVDATSRQTRDGSGLLGRAGLFMQLKECLLNTSRLPFMALTGLPGIGKSALVDALTADQQVRAHFCDGILSAPLGSQTHVLSQLTRWGSLLGVTSNKVENPESPLAWGRALRSAIGMRRMLLILDDAWTVEDALALQIGGPHCTHLLTTRQSQVAFTFAQDCFIVVPQLEEADGLALLARYVPQLVQQDPQAAQSLVQALGSLPLALTLMGRALAVLALTDHPWSLETALRRLHESQEYLCLNTPIISGQSSSSLAEMIPLSLYAVIAICARLLSQDAWTTLSDLAIFPPKPHSFSEEAALVVSKQSPEMLNELYEIGLLEKRGERRYSLHQTVVEYTRARNKF